MKKSDEMVENLLFVIRRNRHKWTHTAVPAKFADEIGWRLRHATHFGAYVSANCQIRNRRFYRNNTAPNDHRPLLLHPATDADSGCLFGA